MLSVMVRSGDEWTTTRRGARSGRSGERWLVSHMERGAVAESGVLKSGVPRSLARSFGI